MQAVGENPPAARLRLRGIRKVYGTVVANDGIDLAVQPGEIHAILGENGAGKSTLMKIIYGVTAPTAGSIAWEGEPVQVQSPGHARSLGIGMVFQHFALFETLTVVQNVALALPGRPDLSDLAQRITAVGRRYGLPVDPLRLVHALSVGERQRVEIIRCLLQNPRLLIMDEPTSVLTPQAVRKLFETLRQLAAEGCSILYISHKLDEIRALCDSATVLRAGRVTGSCVPRQETPASMARMMIGKELVACSPGAARACGAPLLRLRAFDLAAQQPFGVALEQLNLDVHAGEIVGIAGVSGNGQQELLAALSGESPLPARAAGAIALCGQHAGHLGAGARRALGLGVVPEDRLGRGAVPGMSLADNALLTAWRQGLLRAGMVRRAAVRDFAAQCIERFRVRCSGPTAQAGALSGGNLQKFIVGREVLQQPRVLVAAQPTWGVDVGAAAFIRQALVDLRNAGAAVLVVSEELDELFEISDRIAVLANGRLSPAVPTARTDVETIGLWMSGLWPGAQPAAATQAEPEEVRHVAQA
jgi:simple sugar transport system ATP-binding protein